jgi:hypothetical protein
MPADFDEQMRRLAERLAEQVDPSGVLEAVARRTRRRRARRRVQVIALALVVLVGTGLGTWGLWRVLPAERGLVGPPATTAAGPAATSSTLPPREQTVAMLVLGSDLRVVVTASRGGAGDRASVWVVVDGRAGGAWRRLDQRIVGERDGWSWTAISAPTSICQLVASDANPAQLSISLLGSAGGCSRTYGFRVQDGALVAG